MKNRKENIFRRFKDSIYQGSINPKDDQSRIKIIFRSLILHLHPPTLNEKTIKYNHTFGLGGMAIILICIQFISGLLLRFYYEPFPGRAYDSVIHLQDNILFGQLLRNIHYWSAIFLIIITVLHLFRVFFSGAFHGKRQFNWVLGILLLAFVLLSNFTGYLLPWDQLSYWAVTVSTNMLDYIPLVGNVVKQILIGGEEVGSSTLLIFYNFHTGILPILLILVMAFHFWRVRKAGGVVVFDQNENDKYVSTVPNLVAKEFVVAIVLVAFILVIAIISDAPLLDKANPSISPNPAKAPWYFLGIQELMLHFHPLFSVFIIPLILVLGVIFLPYFNYESGQNNKWFYSDKGLKLSIVSAIGSGILTFILVLTNELLLKKISYFDFIPDIISNGLIPFILICIGFVGYFKYLVNVKKANTNEAVQAIFVSITIVFTILTCIGIFFRGEGMDLYLF